MISCLPQINPKCGRSPVGRVYLKSFFFQKHSHTFWSDFLEVFTCIFTFMASTATADTVHNRPPPTQETEFKNSPRASAVAASRLKPPSNYRERLVVVVTKGTLYVRYILPRAVKRPPSLDSRSTYTSENKKLSIETE